MEKLIVICVTFLLPWLCSAQLGHNYKSLDSTDKIIFEGNYIIYKGDSLLLGPKAFFIDGQFTDQEAEKHPYVFNSVNKASGQLTNGTEDSPMILYLAPYVYWIDNPDDSATRYPIEGTTPYGLIIECDWLRFYGLTKNAENVVLACNRGQTIGASGNFTLFKFIGQGTSSENITFGNYCNIDLDFPLKPSLNREKRASAIVQAQLIHCNGDKIVARNTRFVSRLNLCPFVGGKRVLFDNCHFESTDDALCGTGVYLNCSLDFYSSKPFYRTSGTGAVFLNCNIRSHVKGNQYFTKANGQISIIDTRFYAKNMKYLAWRDIPPFEMRNYQYNLTINGESKLISSNDPFATVDMTNKSILDAYRLNYNGEVVYNTYNLLRGDDNWDPMNIKDVIVEIENNLDKKISNLPIQLLIAPTKKFLETGRDSIKLSAKARRFGNYEQKIDSLKWIVAPEYTSFVKLKPSHDGLICNVIPTNTNNEPKKVIIIASTPSGLEAASVLNILPSKLEKPKFISYPKIINDKSGKLSVNYKLDIKLEDQSLITWYRCTDEIGNNPIEVAVSRFSQPLLDYTLTAGDIDYYIMVSVAPKHIRCDAGEAISFVLKKPITPEEVKTNNKEFYSDFKNFSTKNQPYTIPGFWTLKAFSPTENNQNKDAWYYGEGRNGAAGIWGLLQGRSASLGYTPTEKSYSNMKLSLSVAPFKSAGQGFSIAPLYMDVLIKFDFATMTGYALRFIRTTKYHNAVDCFFVKYKNGEIIDIGTPISTSCYRTTCIINLEVIGNKIIAHARNHNMIGYKNENSQLASEIDMEILIDSNKFGGFGIQYNGGASAVIKEMKAVWE